MYSLDESSNDLDRYMKIIESEARELRECNPLSGTRPNFNQNRRNVGGEVGGGGGGYNSRSTDNSGDNYGRQSNGYGGNSGGYGASSSSYGKSGGSNNYGGSNSYGGGSSNYGNQASSSHGGGGGSQDWGSSNFGGTSNNNAGSSNHGNSGSTDWTSKDTGYGGSSNNYGNSGRSNYGSSSASNSYGNTGSSTYGNSAGSNNYCTNSNSHSNANNAGGGSDDWGSANFGGPNNNESKGYTESNNSNSYGNAQSSNYGGLSQSQDKPGSSTTADTYNPQSSGSRNYSTGPPVQEDVDGYQRLDFNRCLISYNEPGNLNIKHVFLNILNRSDLMEYTTKIMEASCQDKIVLAIQRDNQLAESYAYQLRQRGFWSFEVTNKTKDPEKLLKQHSIYRCAVTTMSYLRDNVDQFQFPSLIINFDHVVSHVKFLERFLTYRNPASAIEQKECYIYELCFNHSTTSQNLKEYIQNQQK